jgi:hypothetical protein
MVRGEMPAYGLGSRTSGPPNLSNPERRLVGTLRPYWTTYVQRHVAVANTEHGNICPLARSSRNVWNRTGPDRTPGARGGRRNRARGAPKLPHLSRMIEDDDGLPDRLQLNFPVPAPIIASVTPKRPREENARSKEGDACGEVQPPCFAGLD